LKPLRVLISGGGTGGHIFPAIAIANAIKETHPDAIIEFVGAQDRMEMEKVPAAGYKIHGIWISGFQRELTVKNLMFPMKVVSSLASCINIIRNFKPDIVIGTGGFASGPLLKVACWMGKKTLIQEQNSYAGVTNKILGRKVNKVCLGFEKAAEWFPKDKTVVTGNPVRQNILNIPNQKEALQKLGLNPSLKTVLAVGGSLGARTINQTMDGLIGIFNVENIQVIWQTGKNYVAQNQPKYGVVSQFIDDMSLVYAAADVIISRAGAISISELCIVGKPVILIPSPNVAEDHQTKNAMALVEKGAALLVKDKEAHDGLWPVLSPLMHNEELQTSMKAAIKNLAKPDAANAIAREALQLTKQL
jgi:UDP-N-acetylglucosamine--N-acetylmuramyl-(pentapeptide) pyrophosphoryl-undecaprenol N-acetylglucosamine transferase